ncbi:MAG TPA: dodecin family protein [Gammaproteobacteria bacterium]|nr:dodecin family protein [Gammaproteobacteria bacterium]
MAVAKVIELSASSTKSFEDAIRNGIARASKTVHNISGVWIHDQNVKVENEAVTEWRVIMKVTFVLDD